MDMKNLKSTFKLLSLMAWSVIGSTYAEYLSYHKALRLTLDSNPILKAKKMAVQSKQAEVTQSGLPPNPEAELELEDFGRAEGALLFSQPIELGGKRSRRVGVAKKEKEIAQLEFEIHRIYVLTETAVKFIELWEAQQNSKYWLESVKLADSVLTIISHRFNEGASPAVEKIRAEVELTNTKIKARNSQKRAANAKFKLAAMWGETNPSFDGVEYNVTETLNDLDTNLIFQKLGDSPRMLLQKALIQKQQAQIKLARAERLTDLEVAAGIKREGETGENMAVLGVSIGIPLFNRNQGGIQTAKISHKISEYEEESVKNNMYSELQELITNYHTLKSDVEALKNNSLPGTEKAFEEVRKLYMRGKTSFLDLLDIRRSLLELNSAYVESMAQMNIARIRFEAALGTAFEKIIKGGD